MRGEEEANALNATLRYRGIEPETLEETVETTKPRLTTQPRPFRRVGGI